MNDPIVFLVSSVYSGILELNIVKQDIIKIPVEEVARNVNQIKGDIKYCKETDKEVYKLKALHINIKNSGADSVFFKRHILASISWLKFAISLHFAETTFKSKAFRSLLNICITSPYR
ncbi:hypothetical protein TNCT_712061 [Trichonephila clavata]|uniref:Uncharacterized protein n=1 Tax=Trichonephila clavata TaxID=2740835 RepID=A0A8X6FPL3_TRICU|nr:hypothetical protein TNCT_712061 [Trichonephila clavata]